MEVMIFKIPKEMKEQLDKLATKEERTKAYFIRKAIEKFLEGRK